MTECEMYLFRAQINLLCCTLIKPVQYFFCPRHAFTLPGDFEVMPPIGDPNIQRLLNFF